jgi:hypothetical protein
VIFKPEMVEKILAGEKTVTRRPVKLEIDATWGQEPIRRALPSRYVVGKDYAVQPGRGRPGVARIRILGVTRTALQPHESWRAEEAQREGFETWQAFVDYWLSLYRRIDLTQLVDRIEFELLESLGGGKR